MVNILISVVRNTVALNNMSKLSRERGKALLDRLYANSQTTRCGGAVFAIGSMVCFI